jgi:hypothetical protein
MSVPTQKHDDLGYLTLKLFPAKICDMEKLTECKECAGRGWQGGPLKTFNAEGESVILTNEYKIPCPACGGTSTASAINDNS